MKKMCRSILAILFAATLFAAGGCESQLGTCWLECYPDSGGVESEGPYENYTKDECSDKADVDTTIFRTCYPDWSAY
jgi:hypothetical protein